MFITIGLLLFNGCSQVETANFQVVLDNLDEPRGLLWRADGALCVVETGSLPLNRELNQEHPQSGSDSKAATGALTCLDAAGTRRRLIDGLPYFRYPDAGTSVGPTDVAELDGQLYLLMAEGWAPLSRTILHIKDSQRPPEVVADFLAFLKKSGELEIDDAPIIVLNPFAMVADPANRRFLVTDGATGRVFAADPNGHIAVFSQVDGHEVLTGITWGPDGLAYVTSFSQLPHAAGTGSIVRLDADGGSETILTGLTAPIDLAFDSAGRLYILEFMSAVDTGHPYRGKRGRLLRFTLAAHGWGEPQELVAGLPYPIAIIISPDNSLYLTVHGAFSEPGTGLVLRFADLIQREPNLPPLQYQGP